MCVLVFVHQRSFQIRLCLYTVCVYTVCVYVFLIASLLEHRIHVHHNYTPISISTHTTKIFTMSNNTSTTTTTILPSPTDLLTAEARNAIESTKAETIKNKIRTEHGRKVQQLVSFIINNHRETSNTILVDITPAQKQHVAYPFSSTAMKDINYSDQRITDITLSFLQSKTLKANSTQINSHSHVRKHYDAVLHCAKFANKALPTNFKQQGKLFLDGYKKKHAQHKQIGKVKEVEADPIPFPLYTMLCQWTMQENSFVWAWTVLQWNCMARSSSIDPLGKF